jgi:hypothetical protein
MVDIPSKPNPLQWKALRDWWSERIDSYSQQFVRYSSSFPQILDHIDHIVAIFHFPFFQLLVEASVTCGWDVWLPSLVLSTRTMPELGRSQKLFSIFGCSTFQFQIIWWRLTFDSAHLPDHMNVLSNWLQLEMLVKEAKRGNDVS